MIQRACPLCGEEAVWFPYTNRFHLTSVECSICGRFATTEDAVKEVAKRSEIGPYRLNLIQVTASVQSNRPGVPILWKLSWGDVEPGADIPKLVRNIEDVVDTPIRHADRPDQILRLLAEKASAGRPFDGVEVALAEVLRLRIANWDEMGEWVMMLAENDLVDGIPIRHWTARGMGDDRPLPPMPEVSLTPRGWTRIEPGPPAHGKRFRIFVVPSPCLGESPRCRAW